MSGDKIDMRSREKMLLEENVGLRARLEEAEHTLQAIRSGDVDALIIQGPQGEQVFSLTGVEHVYRVIVETMNEAALTVSANGTILFCNERFASSMKTPMHEVAGRKLTYFTEVSHQPQLMELIAQAQMEPSRRRLMLRAADGAKVPTQFSASFLNTVLTPCICLVASDLTELEASADLIRFLREHQQELETSQQALQLGESRYRELVQNANSAIIRWTKDGTIIFFNEYAQEFFGWSADEAIGKHVSILLPEWASTGVDLTGLVQDIVDHPERYANNINENLCRDGRRVWMTWANRAIRDEHGQVNGVLAIGSDITERKRAEEALRDSQAELRKANEELERKVSERTADLAHKVDELRNANEQLDEKASKLRALAGDLTLTERRERKRLSQILHDGLQQHLVTAKMRLGGVSEQIGSTDLKQTVDEIENMLGESVTMSRSLSTELSPPILYEGGLSDGLEWLARWMRDKHRFSVDLSFDTRPELPEDVKVLVFESVRELLFNAVKHSKTSRARVSLEQVDGAGLRIAVSDEGAGFDPCQLKPVGEEEGFGLFSIRERIGLIGGRLEIDSAPGKGSRFTLIVSHGQAPPVPRPADRMCTPAVEPQKALVKDQGTTIRVLLADDHALFRNGLGRLLKNESGLEIVGHATDGQEAIELAGKLRPDVILMDISMPNVNGIEATHVIHQEYPEISIIGLSMHEDVERAKAMRDAGAVDYKTKGCSASELSSAIRNCMSRRCKRHAPYGAL